MLFSSFKKIPLVIWLTIAPILGPPCLLAESNYVYDQIWPQINPDWYFYRPFAIVADDEDYLYIADTNANRIVKLNSAGRLITHWGQFGSSSGQFSAPQGIAIDHSGLVYVSDTENNRIQRFDSNGNFIDSFGSQGSGPGQFSQPSGLAFDIDGNLYVADTGNHRIQKFDAEMQFLQTWGSQGSGDGQFINPEFLAIDKENYVYVGCRNSYPNYFVQKFTSDGQFVTKWGPPSDVYDTYKDFDWWTAVAVDQDGNIMVAWRPSVDKFNPDGEKISSWPVSYGHANEYPGGGGQFHYSNGYLYMGGWDGITKFTPDGQLLEWWSASALNYSDNRFNRPKGLTTDSSGNVYVADFIHIVKLSPTGEFLFKEMAHPYPSSGVYPQDVAVSSTGQVYVSIREFSGRHHVQVRDQDGSLIKIWGTGGSGVGEIDQPAGIALNSVDDVYLINQDSHRVQQFDKDGNFIRQWGSQGTGLGNFFNPIGIAIDNNDDVYVADSGNNRIQKFSSEGNFIYSWGTSGDGDGELSTPVAIEIGLDGNIYVADKGNHRFQKFTPEGVYINQAGIYGTGPDQMRDPMGIAIDGTSGKILVVDHGNNRVKAYKEVEPPAVKAIILAGGGPYAGNTLWDATQMCANHAYHALTYQGFNKESIYYLTSDTDLDLDYNGLPDDVDSNASLLNLQQAITSWASDAEDLVIYLVDHGGDQTFRVSSTETLGATELATWLDEIQETIPGTVTLVVDACSSGSFLPLLGTSNGKERIVIASASPTESAYFVSQGAISFSNYFWTGIFNGANVKDAFDLSSAAIGVTTSYQNPLLDDNGNGIGNEVDDGILSQNKYIGNGTLIVTDAPAIGSVSPVQTISGTNSATLYAENVYDTDEVARVWATVRPPNYIQDLSYDTVQELPSFDLQPLGGNRWEAVWDQFNIPGTYYISIYARDRLGNTSASQITTVSVNNPLNRKAIIVAAGWQTDILWPAIQGNALTAYNALRFQGYTEENIYVMSDEGIPGVALDGPATRANFFNVLENWASTDSQDVTLYIIADGNYKNFRINQIEDITSIEVDSLLDALQENLFGTITVIYEGCQSGTFISDLLPPPNKQRITISSTSSDQAAYYLDNGQLSFSYFFWNGVADGANVYESYKTARNAMQYATGQKQLANLDDSGNGIADEKIDGLVASNHTLGIGIMLAGDSPLIGSVSEAQTLAEGSTAVIWAADVSSTGTIERVWAEIKPPGAGDEAFEQAVTTLPIITLDYVGGNRYEGSYDAFNTSGTYVVSVFAEDTEGNISIPLVTSVSKLFGQDNFESDDDSSSARIITINDTLVQTHNFHDTGDADWVKFYAFAGESYEVKTENGGAMSDTVITLYAMDGTTEIISQDDSLHYGDDELLSWQCQEDGFYYVKITQYNPADYGANTEYDLLIYQPLGNSVGQLKGLVTDAYGNAINGALIKAEGVDTAAISLSSGSFEVTLPAGTFSITVEKEGYPLYRQNDVLIIGDTITHLPFTIKLAIAGDVTGDGIVDLIDAVVAMRAQAANNSSALVRHGYSESGADIDGDGQPGLAEVIYALQTVTGL